MCKKPYNSNAANMYSKMYTHILENHAKEIYKDTF